MFSMPDMAVILAIALLIFGPKKLPDIGRSLGMGIRDFKKAVEDEPVKDSSVTEIEHKPEEAVQTPLEEDGTDESFAGKES